MIDILSLELSDIEQALLDLGEKKYRAKQIFVWLHKKQAVTFDEMSDLPEALRVKLTQKYTISRIFPQTVLTSRKDDTAKILYCLPDNEHVETVIMRYKYGDTLCVSSQVGCKMGCVFCASGKAGFVRNLTAGEILSQIYETERVTGRVVHNLVMMGIGEPLDNYDNVTKFLRILAHKDGRQMSHRHVSLSTCGLADNIERLSAESTGLTLSVSLHAATDSQRDEIMPINKKYNIARVITACNNYNKVTGRRISFEYAVTNGFNDSDADAKRLAALVKPLGAYVNVIPVNKIRGRENVGGGNAAAFRDKLLLLGVTATVRRTLGEDIEAACGQLRANTENI
ncbi:MAG: 23S rRNA (adenine(2503)-C(2))-methyltransferase RlmN [Oscillospiraceae bacterium]|jgi:23S rRNA (adenine2503-C2)-methyltransferase|nr:23S rRNA (adenine(2503)-C(2))-methyltransferase RlmN [Oscillospiraceae bacterium]